MEIEMKLKELYEKLPHFPDGRIDYHGAKEAVALSCFVKHEEKILLLKRSQKVYKYKGKWNPVGGFIDELKPIEEKVKEELNEELGLKEEDIKSIKVGEPYSFEDKEIGIKWYIVPCLAEVKTKDVKINWEAEDYKWINPEELRNFDLAPKVEESWKRVRKLVNDI